MYFVLSFVIILTSAFLVSCQYTIEDCHSLGFNKADLSCAHCELLPTFNLEDIRSICLECCHHDEDTLKQQKQYGKAVLEMCTCKFGAYPQIQAFIKSDRPAKYSNLQIKFVAGLDPIIKLYDRDGRYQETVAIEKWNTDSVDEFLNTYLIKDDYVDDNSYLRTNAI